MKQTIRKVRTPIIATVLTTSLTGCVSYDVKDSVAWTNQEAAMFTAGHLELARTDRERTRRLETANQLLSEPLTRDAAVQLALVNSPSIQSIIARSWATGANAAQSGRIPNPVFSFERLVSADGDATDVEQFLAFGLLDVLLVPWKQGAAKQRVAKAKNQLTADVVSEITEVRNAWTKAVAAQQLEDFARQVHASADASAEMGRRLEAVGNFSRLQRARQQVFYADATMALATAQHDAIAAREQLIRALGLDDTQAGALSLPETLPEIPPLPIQPAEATDTINERRLDVRMAKANLNAAMKSQGMGSITSFTDVELGYRRVKATDDGNSEELGGYEVEISLPLFDWGGMKRDAMNANTLAAANDYTAIVRGVSSNMRESYSAYRTSYDIAAFYRDEVVPLRSLISEENVLQYNGMMIGVFELLADSRTQIASVMSAIKANEQFWMADAALQATMIGKPMSASVGQMAAAGGDEGAGH